jgi:hypothetical protein
MRVWLDYNDLFLIGAAPGQTDSPHTIMISSGLQPQIKVNLNSAQSFATLRIDFALILMTLYSLHVHPDSAVEIGVHCALRVQCTVPLNIVHAARNATKFMRIWIELHTHPKLYCAVEIGTHFLILGVGAGSAEMKSRH